MDSLPGSGLGIPAGFQEIDPNELTWEEVIGRGAFGMVSRGHWRGMEVAVKDIETDSEQKAFKTELKQLSRVDHPNIVKLFGACTKDTVCLVMEYAEGGSLYNVLHGTGSKPDYTLAHSMSWVLQCAKGVAYLHGMKPKPLIHRDLKPPNLLLMHGGTVLKICDFGTACDAHTYMTNNKGSAAWMAPEVFEGNKYSEKCDVFSWGIILWEVLSRRKPFSEIGGHAFRIMWAVHSGTRPPLIGNCPKGLENLMVRCWSSNPVIRPSMAEVVDVTSKFFQLLEGADLPLIYPTPEGAEVSTPLAEQLSSVYDTPPMSNHSQRTGDMSKVATIKENFRQGTDGEPVPLHPPVIPRRKPVVVEEEAAGWKGTSAPASLAASRESLLELKTSRSSTPISEMANKRFSADLSKITHADIMNVDIGDAATKPRAPPRGHRRTGSYGTPVVNTTPTNHYPTGREVQGHRRTGSFGNTPVTTAAPETEFQHAVSLVHVTTAPGNLNDVGDNFQGGPLRSMSWTQGMAGTALTMDPALIKAILSMDHQLQPLAPCKGNKESLMIFENHCRMALEYLRVQSEVAHLNKCKVELMEELNREDDQQQISEYRQLVNENEDLALLHNNLKKQVQNMKKEGHTL